MRADMSDVYRCPATGATLNLLSRVKREGEVLEGEFLEPGGRTYSITKGVPNFIFPQELHGEDAEVLSKYNESAHKYDTGMEWLFRSFFEDEVAVRTNMVQLLGIQPSWRVLEVGCGTGRDSQLIARELSNDGQLYLQELSAGMIEICRDRMNSVSVPVDYSLSNASYLPFSDNCFDALYHFGGINTFSEKRRAFSEFTRVVKPGGVIVVGDEGVPPWLRDHEFGKILINANKYYEHTVPLADLPESARNVSVRWVLGNAFYVIRYEVGEGSPPIDLDLPIPGKGDSLRSRYEQRKQ